MTVYCCLCQEPKLLKRNCLCAAWKISIFGRFLVPRWNQVIKGRRRGPCFSLSESLLCSFAHSQSPWGPPCFFLFVNQSHLVCIRVTGPAPLCRNLKRQRTQDEVQAAPAGRSVTPEDPVTNRTTCSAREETKTYVQQRVKDWARQNQAIKADELQLRRQSDNHSPDTSLNHMKEEHGNKPLSACTLQPVTMMK